MKDFRDCEIIPSLRRMTTTAAVQKREAFGREMLLVEAQVYAHEGFLEGDVVRITIEKKIEAA